MEKGKRGSEQIAEMQETIRGNGERLARARAAIGSMDAHLSDTERQSKQKPASEKKR